MHLVIIRYSFELNKLYIADRSFKLYPVLFTNNDKFYSHLVLQFRFTLLCHAACEAPLVLPLGGYTFGEKCLFMVNDWHAGLVPL